MTGSILPAAVLVLLPKCPLCLAAWLTVATGASFSAAAAGWVRPIIVLLWVAVAAQVMWLTYSEVHQRLSADRAKVPREAKLRASGRRRVTKFLK